MNRLIDFLLEELSLLAAVLQFRIRSYILFLAALIAPVGILMAARFFLPDNSLLGLNELFLRGSQVFAVIVMLRLLALSIATYLKDRTAFLRY